MYGALCVFYSASAFSHVCVRVYRKLKAGVTLSMQFMLCAYVCVQ